MPIDPCAALSVDSVPTMGAECARLLVMGGCTAEEVALTKARLMGKPQSLSVSRMKRLGGGRSKYSLVMLMHRARVCLRRGQMKATWISRPIGP
jgi:hypothetical protein